jgi:hypothetical protein
MPQKISGVRGQSPLSKKQRCGKFKIFRSLPLPFP